MESIALPLWMMHLMLLVGPPPQTASPTAQPAPPVTPLSNDVVQEILDIRRHGGSMLEGTIFGPGGEFGSTDKQFADMLRQIAAEENAKQPALLTPSTQPARIAPNEALPPNGRAELLDSLEASVELLGAEIRQLERSGNYHLSDKLQRTVRQIRLTARALRAVRSADAASP